MAQFDFLDQVGSLFGEPRSNLPVVAPKDEVAQNTRGDRNNNPGNLEASSWAQQQPGYKGSDGRFAIFATRQDGERAQESLLRDGKRYKGKSVAGIIGTYAPHTASGGDNSDASHRNYIGYVSARAGVDPDKPVPPEKIPHVAAAMREFETGKTAQVGFKPYGGSVSTYNANSPGAGVADPSQFLAGLESVLGPEAKASQNVQQNSSATFNSDEEMARRAGAVETQLGNQGTAIDVLDSALQVAHAGQVEAMTRQVNDTRAISSEIASETQALTEKVKPIFQARGRIADQLDKVNTMNPLERGIRGIFDLNYDQDYLTGQLDRFDRTLRMRAEDYKYLGDLHQVALQEIERRYTLDTAIPGLIAQQAQEDLGIVGMRISQTSGMLGSLRDSISAESQLIQAKAVAREDLLNRLDGPTVVDLMSQAQANGGLIAFNGVEFSYKELRDRIQTDEQRNLQVEAYKMSIASSRMDIAQQYATNIARSLTREQVQSAMANGGVWNGVQLPQDVLTQAYQGMIQRDSIQAETIANTLPANLALRTATDSLNQATGLFYRVKNLFGGKGVQSHSPYLSRGSELIQQLVQATKTGAPPETITALTQAIAKNSEAYTKAVDSQILTAMGGDKRGAGYMKGFVYGTPMPQGTAVEAITYFALKGNLPEGMQLSPEAKQVFSKAQKLVETHRTDKVNGRAISEAQLTTLVSRELGKAAPGIVGQARFGRVWNDLPAVAGKMQHPLGKLDNNQWQQILANSRQDAANGVAAQLKTTPETVTQMAVTRKPISTKPEDVELYKAFVENAGKYNALEQMSMIDGVDKLPQVTTGRRNSSVLSDFLASPQAMEVASGYTASVGSQSMGDYLVNPLSDGSLETMMTETRQGILASQAQASAGARAAARNQPYGMMLQPVNRATVIMSSIDGVGQEGAKALAPTIQSIIEEYRSGQGWANGVERPNTVSPNATMVHEDSVIYNRLSAIKFQDPRLETYRKQVVKNWQTHATQTKSTLERIMEVNGMVMDSVAHDWNPINWFNGSM